MTFASCLAVCLLFVTHNAVIGQQITPFEGQGLPPTGGVDVFVSAALDRLLSVDDSNYRFEVVLFIMLTWTDARAYPAALASTAVAASGNDSCNLPCSSMYAAIYTEMLCCDGVWLPHLEFVNARGFSQDRIVRYGIRFGDTVNSSAGAVSDAVAWWAHVQGEFYTNLEFLSFPFDHQQLVVQMAYADRTPDLPVRFFNSSTAEQLFMPRAGDDISGWNLKGVRFMSYAVPASYIPSITTKSNPNDPWGLNPVDPNAPHFVSILWKEGFAIIIEIERISLYYVLIGVIPIVLNCWLALLVFSMSPKELEARLLLVVTLFLSLTAMMWVMAGDLPKSSTVVPTQLLCIISYFVLGIVGLESIIVYNIMTVQKRQNVRQRTQAAKRQFLQRIDAMPKVRRKKLNRRSPAVPQRSQQPLEAVLEDGSGANDGAASAAPSSSLNPSELIRRETSMGLRIFSHESSRDIGARMESNPGRPSNGISSDDDTEGSSSSHPSDSPQGQSDAFAPSPAAASPKKKKKASLWKKWKEMKQEMRKNPDFALYVAFGVDRFILIFTMLMYNLGVILIFALTSSQSAIIEM